MQAADYKTLKRISLEVEAIAKETSQKLAKFDKDSIHIFYAENILSLPQDARETITKNGSNEYLKFIKNILQKESKATAQQRETTKKIREIVAEGNKKIQQAYIKLLPPGENPSATITEIPTEEIIFQGKENLTTSDENNSSQNIAETPSKKPPRRFFID